MKFVIRSLLFVNLILQLTNSLRKCFDNDQNIMITIILLAFSLIGLIGLVIGNRFILIIFSASMTLILIASITIYAIGKTEPDSMKPKVPYYTNPSDQDSDSKRPGDPNKLKSLVGKWLNRNQDTKRNKKSRTNRTRSDLVQQQKQRIVSKKYPTNSRLPLVAPAILDDYTDESTSLSQFQLIQPPTNTRSMPVGGITIDDTRNTSALGLKKPSSIQVDGVYSGGADKLDRLSEHPNQDHASSDHDSDDVGQVENEQWINYERYLYERYLNIVSQSIDLIMHSILAAWMALLLDEDADQCFGSKSSRRNSRHRSRPSREAPVYNYNGVRYSIRPDVNDSPTRIVVR